MQLSGFGFAVFNYDEIMKKYEEFVNKWKAAGAPELYFVTMDIEKCYDSVDSRKVCELLRRTDLLDKEYYALSCIVLKRKNNVLVQKDTPVKEPIKNHFRHKFHKIGIDGGQYPTLFEILAQDNDFNFKRTLVVEQEHRKKLFKKDLLTPIDYIIQNNYITFNKSQYKQTKGIPQGMCVSYILSSFYYACLEEQALGFLKQDKLLPNGSMELNCVMRQTDDYLLMTTSKTNAMLFIERLYGLSLANKFRFNMAKLRTNFPLNVAKISYAIENAKAIARAAALAAKGEKDTTSTLEVGERVRKAQKSLDEHQYQELELFNWIGISIDMKTLGLVPNINVKKDAILCTLNTNM